MSSKWHICIAPYALTLRHRGICTVEHAGHAQSRKWRRLATVASRFFSCALHIGHIGWSYPYVVCNLCTRCTARHENSHCGSLMTSLEPARCIFARLRVLLLANTQQGSLSADEAEGGRGWQQACALGSTRHQASFPLLGSTCSAEPERTSAGRGNRNE